ncbi:MAG: hypothetical protein WC917_01970 [Bacilli bacterium]|jgi:hypothetical protein
MKKEEKAWAAGLVEGEGSTIIHGGSLRATLQSTDLDVLENLKEIFGGTIYPLGLRMGHLKEIWMWSTSGESAIIFLNYIYKYLGKRRKKRIDEAFNNFYINNRDEKLKNLTKFIINLNKKCIRHKDIAEKACISRSYVTKILNNNGIYSPVNTQI